jgi:hypothetical protein
MALLLVLELRMELIASVARISNDAFWVPGLLEFEAILPGVVLSILRELLVDSILYTF